MRRAMGNLRFGPASFRFGLAHHWAISGTSLASAAYLVMPTNDLPQSPAIERVAYDPSTRALTVWFRKGRRYEFFDVPAEVYQGLCGDGDVPCDRFPRWPGCRDH